jgi:hypothetical protein
MLRRSALGAALALVVVGLACSDLKHADDAADAGGGDGSANGSDADTADGAIADAEPDVGQPPNDFECGTDAWTKATKTNPDCAMRRVFVVGETVDGAVAARRHRLRLPHRQPGDR